MQIDLKMIPPEVVEAAARVIADANGWRDEQGFKACVPLVDTTEAPLKLKVPLSFCNGVLLK